jgi:hypothetical protein
MEYIIIASTTKATPKIENHFAPFFSIKELKVLPNLAERKATIKNLKPRASRQIKKKTNKSKFIIPLVIVKSLKGNGVKPARNSVPNHAACALPLEVN